MKKSKNILVFVLTAALVLSVGINAFQLFQTMKVRKDLTAQQDKVTFYEENYSPMYEYFTGLSVLEFEKKVARKDEFIVYFGRPDCGDCIEFEPMFKEVIEEHQLRDKMYYVNVKWKREANKEQWEDFKNVYGFSQTPAYVQFKDGKPVSMIEWDENKGLTKSELKAWFTSIGLEDKTEAA